jgi:uncharacterized protein YbjT (DUF2867 family)
MSAQDTPPGRALVTGATGFIGSRVCTDLLARGFRVRVLVREPARAPAHAGVEVFAGDLTRPADLVGLEEGVDLVVHCAILLGKWGTD